MEQLEDFRISGKKRKFGNSEKYYMVLRKLAYLGSRL